MEKKGKAPKAPTSQHIGKKHSRIVVSHPIVLPNNQGIIYETEEIETQSYNLHHIDAIANGGPVYDLSNLAIVTPLQHFSALKHHHKRKRK